MHVGHLVDVTNEKRTPGSRVSLHDNNSRCATFPLDADFWRIAARDFRFEAVGPAGEVINNLADWADWELAENRNCNVVASFG